MISGAQGFVLGAAAVKRVLLGVLAVVLGLGGVLVVRTVGFKSVQRDVPAAPAVTVDANAAAEHLAAAVRVVTISESSMADRNTFMLLRALLRQQYPQTFQKLQVEEVGDSLLFTWKGSDAALAPIVLCGHLDVVPVEPGSESAWKQQPFAGVVEGGFVWGRGTLDDKGSVIAILEATELLLKAGHMPKRTVIYAFGHDEEVGGSGAVAMAAKLKERGVKALYVLDEGLARIRGIIPGVKADVALLGVAEKGFVSVELLASTESGHSSMPPAETAVGRLSKALVRLESTPTEASLEGPTAQLLDTVGPEMGFGLKLVMANRWLLGPVVLSIYNKKDSTRATVRTTVAPTMLKAGVKENVLAREARAVVNFRIRPGETRESVIAWVEQTVADDRVKVTELAGSISSNPSPVTRRDSAGYQAIEKTLRSVFTTTVVAPSLVLGATDGRHYQELSDAVIRFGPVLMEQEDLARLHGVNERLSVEVLGEMVRFYRQLIVDAG
jgi:carboxypeptidase PM20D1